MLLFFLSFLPASAQVSVLPGEFSYTAVSKKDSAYIIGRIAASQRLEYTRLDSAIAITDSIIALSKSRNFTYGTGNAYIARAIYAMTRGNYKESDSLFREAYFYCYLAAQTRAAYDLLALWYEQRGILASYEGDYSRAMHNSYKALQLLDKQPGDTTLRALRTSVYNSIGSVLQYLGQPEKGLYYLEKGEALALKHKDSNNLAQLYVNFGNAYIGMKQWDKAEAALQKGVAISEARHNTFVAQVAYLSLAGVSRSRGNNDTAVAYLNKALAVSDKTNPYMAKVYPSLMLGKIYLEKGQKDKSIYYGNEALNKATQIGASQYVGEAHGLLADAYQATGEWRQAYLHREAEHQVIDSITSAGKMLDINQLEVRSRVAEKDKLLAQQSLSLSRQHAALREKNFWIAGIAFCTLLLAALLVSIRRSHRHKQGALKKETEIVRLKALMDGEEQERSRIASELHDGVVSQLLAVKLNLTTALSRQQHIPNREDFDRSLRYLEEAMQDLRHTAHNLMPVTGNSNDLSGMISDFCRKVGYGTDTEVIYKAFGSGLPEAIRYPLPLFRIVQELVQNALKHASARYILVQLNCEPDLLGISVEDDGCGFNTEERGAGLSGLRERVSRLQGQLTIDSGLQGTSFYLEFTQHIYAAQAADEHL